MLLSFRELVGLAIGEVVTNVGEDQINSSSIDITLGRYVLVEGRHPMSYPHNGGVKAPGPDQIQLPVLVLRERTPMFTYEHDLETQGPLDLHPGQFILGQSEQTFNLPNNISAEYKLKSSMARIGLEHLNAGWCDAGWNGSVLTLELKNMTRYHIIRLQQGDAIGQVVFFLHNEVPAERSYAARGRYNGDTKVEGIKP